MCVCVCVYKQQCDMDICLYIYPKMLFEDMERTFIKISNGSVFYLLTSLEYCLLCPFSVFLLINVNFTYIKILKDDAVKVLHSICQQIWKTQQWPQGWKRSVFIPIPKKGNAKECSNYCTIALISYTSKAQNSPSSASEIREP